TRMSALERVPVIGKDPREDPPVSRELCHHRVAPSGGDDLCAVKRLSHGVPASSTPHRPVPGYPSPASFILAYGNFRDWENEFSYTMDKVAWMDRFIRKHDFEVTMGNVMAVALGNLALILEMTAPLNLARHSDTRVDALFQQWRTTTEPTAH